MTILLGRMLNGVCWGVVARLRGSDAPAAPASVASQTPILVATL